MTGKETTFFASMREAGVRASALGRSTGSRLDSLPRP